MRENIKWLKGEGNEYFGEGNQDLTKIWMGNNIHLIRNDLRSMSQRLERLLRERREATERGGRVHFSHREELEVRVIYLQLYNARGSGVG